MTDSEIIKALECCLDCNCKECPCFKIVDGQKRCTEIGEEEILDLINRQMAEMEKLEIELKAMRGAANSYKAEVERLQLEVEAVEELINPLPFKSNFDKAIETAKSDAIKEFAEKITEIFTRYAHLHTHADKASADEIEAVDGTKIEMQSVWDVFTLKENEMTEYEEMNTLQENIETIAKERLLTELEKDFRLLVKEMTEACDNGEV